MNDRSLLHRFVRVSREFGFAIATRVAYSKIRGMLRPALALPDAPLYNARRREVSVLLDTADQSAATLAAIVEAIAGRGAVGWEVCICEHSPVEPKMALALACLRGTQPWIRVVAADESVSDTTAARWTVEQATGQFIALVAPDYAPQTEAIARLLDQMHNDAGIDAAALIGTDSDSRQPSAPETWTDCRLLLQRKSGYLATMQEHWPLTAPALAKELEEAGASIAYNLQN